MRLLFRSLIVVFALLAACIAGGIVLAVAVLLPERKELATGFASPGTLSALVSFGLVFVGVFALLPAALVAIVTEVFRIRSAVFYLVIGSGIGFAVFTSLSTWDWSLSALDADTTWHIEALVGAGLIAGLVYWAIAGCNAGAWRHPGHR